VFNVNNSKKGAFPEYGIWRDCYRDLAKQSLQYCPDFPQRAARHEQWWTRSNSRPLFLVKGLSAGESRRSRHFEELANPDEWLKAKTHDLANTHFLFDALPYVHLDQGASVLAGLLGGRTTYAEDHAWIAPLFSDWIHSPEWKLDSTSAVTNQLSELLDVLLPEITGKALLMSPNLGSAADALMNLMGPEKVCQSLIEHPGEVQTTLEEIEGIRKMVYTNLMNRSTSQKVGMIHWCELWSDIPYLILECELGALVGSKHFEQFLMPDIQRQAETTQRTIFHICGEDSFRHLDAVLEIPGISAFQYVPRKGNRAADKLDEMKKIQQRGFPLQIAVFPNEPRDLMKVLDPAGLCFLVLDALPMDQLEDLTHLVSK
jgi:hypothetical protein